LNKTLVVVLPLVLILLGALLFLLRPDPAPGASRERAIDLSTEDGTMTPDLVVVAEGIR
jgi:hypothetical protein